VSGLEDFLDGCPERRRGAYLAAWPCSRQFMDVHEASRACWEQLPPVGHRNMVLHFLGMGRLREAVEAAVRLDAGLDARVPPGWAGCPGFVCSLLKLHLVRGVGHGRA